MAWCIEEICIYWFMMSFRRSESYILALDLAHTKATTSRYVEELDRVWNDLSTNAKKETKVILLRISNCFLE